MKKTRRIIAILLIAVLTICLAGCVGTEELQQNSVNLEFRNKALLSEHFEKHGEEFPYSSEEEYLAGANRALSNPNILHKTEKEDGDDVYYLEATNEFLIVSKDGYIRTYFKPRKGMEYYNKQ